MKKEGFRAFRTLLPYIKEYRNNLLLGILALIIVDVAQLFVPQFIKTIVDVVVSKRGLGEVAKYSLFILGAAVIVLVFRFFWRKYLAGTAVKIEELLRNRLFGHLEKLSMDFYTRYKTGDLMAHATNDMLAVRRAMMPGLVILVDIFVMGGLAFFFMLSISLRLTLISIIPFPFLIFIVLKFSSLIHDKFERVQEAFSAMTAKVSESLSGIRIIKAYVQEKGDVKHFAQQSSDYVKKNINLVKIWGFFFPLIMFFANIAIFIVLLFGGRNAILGRLSIGEFVAFQAYLWILVWPMIAIGWVINLFQRGAASMGRINRLLEEKPRISSPKKPVFLKSIQGRIEIKNLYFSYNGKDVLSGINLSLEPGKIVGIIGFVGSGKSTLVSFIPRIQDPPPKTVLIDGYDVRKIELSLLRDSVGFVPQDPFLFSTTIRENIAFGKENVSEEEIIEAARMAGILEEIESFPKGFDTMVGERGITLSGGQKQRITISRAIIKDPKILILDDALSSVDADKEAQIIKNLYSFLRKRAVIIISQRPKSISFADEIIVMDRGRIAERGSHRELLKRNGIYALFWRLQGVEV